MLNQHIYLDHNSTTPLLPVVKEAMVSMMGEAANPSSAHFYGRKAKSLLSKARNTLSNLLGASSEHQVIFTGSGTEANNIALNYIAGYEIICSCIEHSSVLQKVGQGVIPCDSDGIIRLDAVETILSENKDKKFVISVMLANNETGVVQPIKELVQIAHKFGSLVHTDATQAIGKIKVDIAELGVDMLTLSAHKFGGPVGVGALIFRKQIEITPIMYGGGQEYRFRPGTQSVININAMAVALEAVDLKESINTTQMRDYLEAKIKSQGGIIVAGNVSRLPNTSCIEMPDITSETQVIYFDTNNICVSAGSACSSGKSSAPYVLLSMGYGAVRAKNIMRVSLASSNTYEEIDIFLEKWYNLRAINN